MHEVTQILNAIDQGDPHAAEQLLPLVYQELRKLATQKLSQEKPGQTLQATALVHEAYLRLVGGEKESRWENQSHFFAAAAEAMRRIVIERARSKATVKRGGHLEQLDLDAISLADDRRAAELLALDDALRALEQHDSAAANLVKLRYFAGLSHQDAASVLGISRRAADRLWTVAKAWLFRELSRNS